VSTGNNIWMETKSERVWTGFLRLRIRRRGKTVWTRSCTFVFTECGDYRDQTFHYRLLKKRHDFTSWSYLSSRPSPTASSHTQRAWCFRHGPPNQAASSSSCYLISAWHFLTIFVIRALLCMKWHQVTRSENKGSRDWRLPRAQIPDPRSHLCCCQHH
jgi:hypothetical protein